MTILCALLTSAFALGLWRMASARLSLRIAAALIFVNALVVCPGVLFAPMHMRGTLTGDMPSTDLMHIGFTILAVLLMVSYMAFGSAGLGTVSRLFAFSIAAMLLAGVVVGTKVSAIAAGLPTPWMGLVERVSVYSPMLWVFVFAASLLSTATGPEVRKGRQRRSAVEEKQPA